MTTLNLTQITNGRILTPQGWLKGGSIIVDGAGHIAEISDTEATPDGCTTFVDARGMYIVPGAIEMHVHGGGGRDFMEGTEDAFRTAIEAHMQHGTTAIYPTLSSSSVPMIMAAAETTERMMREKSTPILGLHLEGPYFNKEQAGGQMMEYITAPRPEDYRMIMSSTHCIKRWDEAPELIGTEDFGRACVANDIMPAIAHTKAEYRDVKRAWDVGFRHATHFYNAMTGFHKVRKVYRSAYEATVDRTTSTIKLASVVNTTAAFRGGNNTEGWDDTYRSLLGRPATNISLTSFRSYARNRGTAGLNGKGWNCDLYEAQLNTYWLFVIEYANLNCQDTYTAQLTQEGYRQGGLGDGVTTLDYSKWNSFNGRNPFVPCGITNSLGNATGVVDYEMPEEYGAAITVHVPSYRGIENPFGHVWSWTDGILVKAQSEEAGGKHLFYRAVEDNPANFSSSSYEHYVLRGELPRSDGYVKQILCGENGDNMPKAVGGSSTTYFADYFYQNIPSSGEATRGVYFGGLASIGAYAGLASASTHYAPSFTYTYFGSRLCFIPAA